jgi:hypothetical protein
MATPNKKMYDRKGKLIFDPNNPEDVRRQEKMNQQMEMAKQLFSIVDPRGGGGLTGLAKIVGAKAGKEVLKDAIENVVKGIKKTTKSTAKKGGKKAEPVVEKVVEKPVEVVKETLSRLLKPIPKLNKSKSFTTAKAKNALDEIPKDKPSIKTTPTKSDDVIPKINRKSSYSPEKPNSIGSFKIGESVVGSSQASKVIPEVIPNTIPKATEKIKDSDNLFKNRYGKEEFKKIYSDFDKFKLNDDVINNSFLKGLSIAGASGVGAGTVYFSMKNKSDVKLDETKLKDSTKYKGVKIIKVDGKDKGIIKDSTTGKWRYFNEDKDGVLLPQKSKQQEEKKVTGGGYIPIDNNNQNKGNNQGSGVIPIENNQRNKNTGGGGGTNTGDRTGNSGTGTKPRSATGQAFDKAFAEARKQAGGAGGIFEFNNKKYGTALEGETVPKNRVEVGKKEEYPTFKSDPSLEKFRQDDDNRQIAIAEAQKKEMEAKTTKPLSSLVFKSQNESKGNTSKELISMYDEERTMDAENRYNAAKNNMPKKKYGGKLAMLKYMKK